MVKANAVCQADDEVDELYDQVYRELLLFMIQDPDTIQRATYLLWVAHDLERIADRATNIAERVIFLITGKLVEITVSRYLCLTGSTRIRNQAHVSLVGNHDCGTLR